ncbi:MAG TPA: aliphatic sulfonate ABC transporter substrate-binding protein [bacterium]|nr:aliphatic sulfonate ABC transporter substrate-binding protein [bacterium]
MRLSPAFFLAGLLAASLAQAQSPSGGMPAAAPVTVRIGYQPTSSAILLGKDKGFYEKAFAPLNAVVEYDLFLSGPLIIEATAGKRLDLMCVGNLPPLIGYSNGVDVKVIAKAAFNPATNAVLVKPQSPIESVADLKGKRVAVQVGSSVHYFLEQVLKGSGLGLKDVELVNLPGPDQGPALQSGSVDAIVLWMPYRTQLEQAGKARVLVDSSNVPGNLSLYMTRGAFGQAHPQLVEAFLAATKKSNDYLRRHPREALRLLAASSQFPEKVMAESLKGFDWSMTLGEGDIRAMDDIKGFLLKNGILRHDFKTADLFDRHYLAETKFP